MSSSLALGYKAQEHCLSRRVVGGYENMLLVVLSPVTSIYSNC